MHMALAGCRRGQEQNRADNSIPGGESRMEPSRMMRVVIAGHLRFGARSVRPRAPRQRARATDGGSAAAYQEEIVMIS